MTSHTEESLCAADSRLYMTLYSVHINILSYVHGHFLLKQTLYLHNERTSNSIHPSTEYKVIQTGKVGEERERWREEKREREERRLRRERKREAEAG